MEKTSAPNPVVFTLTIPWDSVQVSYDQHLDALTQEATISGFRKGRAPKKLVEEKIGKKSILSDVIEKVVPPAYKQEIVNRNITPFINPRLKPLVLQEGKDWQFEVAVIVRPIVDLRDYEQKVKDALSTGTIIVPGKQEAQTRDQKMAKAFDALLSAVHVELPDLLVEEEMNVRLGQLVDQLQSVGMTVEQYLQSKRITTQQLRQSYEKTARDMLVLNLALDEIASQKSFTEKDRIPKVVDWLLSH